MRRALYLALLVLPVVTAIALVFALIVLIRIPGAGSPWVAPGRWAAFHAVAAFASVGAILRTRAPRAALLVALLASSMSALVAVRNVRLAGNLRSLRVLHERARRECATTPEYQSWLIVQHAGLPYDESSPFGVLCARQVAGQWSTTESCLSTGWDTGWCIGADGRLNSF